MAFENVLWSNVGVLRNFMGLSIPNSLEGFKSVSGRFRRIQRGFRWLKRD